jgi:glycosyltransferase involved in cell wall biosynthesis
VAPPWRCRRVLHVVPYEPSRMRPIVDTVGVCRAAGIASSVVASVPPAERHELGEVDFVAPTELLSVASQQRFLLWHALKESWRFRPDLVIAHQALGLAAGASAASAARCLLVYHCEDFGSDNRLVYLVERAAAVRAREVWFPSVERARVHNFETRAIVVRNCGRLLHDLPAHGSLRPWLAARGSHVASNSRLILRHGVIGPGHCVLETVEALASLDPRTELVVLGSGDPQYVRACHERARSLGVQHRVHIHPFRTHSDLLPLLVDGDVAMCAYEPIDVGRTAGAGPMKLYESIAVGMPVVVDEGCSFAREVVEAGIGIAVPTARPEQLVRALIPALQTLLERRGEMGKLARQAHLARFNFEMEMQRTLLGPHLCGACPSALARNAS